MTAMALPHFNASGLLRMIGIIIMIGLPSSSVVFANPFPPAYVYPVHVHLSYGGRW